MFAAQRGGAKVSSLCNLGFSEVLIAFAETTEHESVESAKVQDVQCETKEINGPAVWLRCC